MVNDVRTFLYASLYRRISSVATTGVCILCSFPQPAICLAVDGSESKEFVSDIVNHISDGNSDHLIERFDELEEVVQLSEDPLNESRKFLQSFIEELNIRHGLNLTIPQACVLVRENLHALQLPVEAQNLLLDTIALIESDSNPTTEQMQHFEKATRPNVEYLRISWPWQWNWFGLNEKSHKNSKPSPAKSFTASPLLQAAGTDKELPGTMYVGGVEALAGALVFTLGLVFPPAYGVGGALMIDGARRVFNGLEEMDGQRSPGSDQSSGPLNTNF
jgi:hypothetical protein